MILSSLIEPTTLTLTSAFLASYSATTFLNSLSSRALQPTQIVRFVAVARSGAADVRCRSDRGGEHETYERDDDRRFASHRDLLLGALPVLPWLDPSHSPGRVRKLYE